MSRCGARSELRLAYALTWSLELPLQTGLAQVVETSVGRGGKPGEDRPADLRHVAIDFGAGARPERQHARTRGQARVQQRRLPAAAAPAERARAAGGSGRLPPGGERRRAPLPVAARGRPVSETWLFRLDKV